MRHLWSALALMVACVACSQPTQPTPPSVSGATTSAQGPAAQARIDRANIKRIRGEFPLGYERTDLTGAATPASLWGLGPGWAAEPAQCAALADPAANGADVAGLSGSGPGGTLYVVVAPAAPGTLAPDPVVLADCGQWTMTYGRTTATSALAEAPQIDGAGTLGISSAITMFVESNTETDSRAWTFVAYLGDNVAFVTLITDPGLPEQPLPPQFAADLLVKTVSALRA